MKISRIYLFMLMAMVMSFGMIACGSDDDKSNPEGGGGAVNIVGVWRLVSVNGSTDLQYEAKRRYSFNSDHTYLLEDQKSDNMTWRKRKGGTYVFGNNKIILTRTGYYSGNDYYRYDTPIVEPAEVVSMSDKTFTISDGKNTMVFERESYNDSAVNNNEGSNGGSDGGSGSTSIVGVWRLTDINGNSDLQYEAKRRYTFSSDFTYLLEDQKNDNMNWRRRNTGTYEVRDNKITLTRTGYYSGEYLYWYDSPIVETVDIASQSQNSFVIKLTEYSYGQPVEYSMTFVRESYDGGGSGGDALPDSIRG